MSSNRATRGNALVMQFDGPSGIIAQVCSGISGASLDYPEQMIDVLPDTILGEINLVEQSPDYDRFFSVLEKNQVRYLFQLGDASVLDKTWSICREAERRQLPLKVLHLPISIANDLIGTDHCLGFASAALVVAHLATADELDNRSFYNGVKINVTPEKHAGWLAASSLLGRNHCIDDEDSVGPQLIYVPETPFCEVTFLNDVQRVFDRLGHVTIVVSEGILEGDIAVGQHLVSLVKRHLGIRARSDHWGYLRRGLPGKSSAIDEQEAFWAGAMAVRYMMQGHTDKMVAFERTDTLQYRIETSLVDLQNVVGKRRLMPTAMLGRSGSIVTQDFIDYARPMLGEYAPFFASRGLGVARPMFS